MPLVEPPKKKIIRRDYCDLRGEGSCLDSISARSNDEPPVTLDDNDGGTSDGEEQQGIEYCLTKVDDTMFSDPACFEVPNRGLFTSKRRRNKKKKSDDLRTTNNVSNDDFIEPLMEDLWRLSIEESVDPDTNSRHPAAFVKKLLRKGMLRNSQPVSSKIGSETSKSWRDLEMLERLQSVNEESHKSNQSISSKIGSETSKSWRDIEMLERLQSANEESHNSDQSVRSQIGRETSKSWSDIEVLERLQSKDEESDKKSQSGSSQIGCETNKSWSDIEVLERLQSKDEESDKKSQSGSSQIGCETNKSWRDIETLEGLQSANEEMCPLPNCEIQRDEDATVMTNHEGTSIVLDKPSKDLNPFHKPVVDLEDFFSVCLCFGNPDLQNPIEEEIPGTPLSLHRKESVLSHDTEEGETQYSTFSNNLESRRQNGSKFIAPPEQNIKVDGPIVPIIAPKTGTDRKVNGPIVPASVTQTGRGIEVVGTVIPTNSSRTSLSSTDIRNCDDKQRKSRLKLFNFASWRREKSLRVKQQKKEKTKDSHYDDMLSPKTAATADSLTPKSTASSKGFRREASTRNSRKNLQQSSSTSKDWDGLTAGTCSIDTHKQSSYDHTLLRNVSTDESFNTTFLDDSFSYRSSGESTADLRGYDSRRKRGYGSRRKDSSNYFDGIVNRLDEAFDYAVDAVAGCGESKKRDDAPTLCSL